MLIKNVATPHKVAPVNTGDMLHHMHCTQKWDADAEYFGKVKMTLSSWMGGFNFADPANIRKAHEELMTQVRTKAMHISNKNKI